MDGAVGQGDGVVFRLTYRSHNVIAAPQRHSELGRLFSAARSFNHAHDLTGALLLSADVFVQTLEGEQDTVLALMDRIRADRRHDHLEVIDTSPVDLRVFGWWSMARVGDNEAADLPLIAHADGIAPAARRADSTPGQDRVLDLMRAAARGRQPA